MAQIASTGTQTNSKGVVTKMTLIAKTQQQIEDEEFEKKWNDPTNLTLKEARQLSHNHIDTLKWDK